MVPLSGDTMGVSTQEAPMQIPARTPGLPEPSLAGAHSRSCHRRRHRHARTLRIASRHLRRLHRQRTRSRIHRGLPPRPGAPPLRQHPHRVERHRPPDHSAARRRPRDRQASHQWRRRHLRHLLRGWSHRSGRPPHRRARPAAAIGPRGRVRAERAHPGRRRPVVFTGPFEHHSNELPWRESIADVVRIPEDADGHIDQGAFG